MMEKTPKVSVVVPNYNYARFLEQRIESVLAQTYTDFELILLDDASTDESRKVLERYKTNSHVTHVVVNEQNTGSPFRQWMKGLGMARGKYVWIAEADDCAEPDFLATCMEQLEQEPDAAICYVGSMAFDAMGGIEQRDINHWGKRAKNVSCCYDGHAFAAHNLYWKNYIINASGVVFNREYALSLEDKSFLNMRYCGDWLFWFQMALKGNVIEIYRPLNYFRQHTARVTAETHHSEGGIKEDIYVVRRMEQSLPGLSSYKKKLRRGRLYRKIKRLHVDKAAKKPMYAHLYETLDCTSSVYYTERFNQFLRFVFPHLLTARRDRL